MKAIVLEHPTMTKRKQCRRLVDVLEMTTAMVEVAKQGRWLEVAEMEERRREELNECFAYKIEDSDSYLMAEALATVLHLNEELMSVVASARKELIQQQRESSRANSGLNNYLDVSCLS